MYARIVGTIGLAGGAAEPRAVARRMRCWSTGSASTSPSSATSAPTSGSAAGHRSDAIQGLSIGLARARQRQPQLRPARGLHRRARSSPFVLYVVIRRTRVGLEMRALVDRDSLGRAAGREPAAHVGDRVDAVDDARRPRRRPDRSVVQSRRPDLRVRGLRVARRRRHRRACGRSRSRSPPVSRSESCRTSSRATRTTGFPNFLSSALGPRRRDARTSSCSSRCSSWAATADDRSPARSPTRNPRPTIAPDCRGWRRKLPWAIFTAVLVLYTLGAFPWPNNPYFVRSGNLAPGLSLAIVFLWLRGGHRHRRHGQPRAGHVRDRGRVHGRLGAPDVRPPPPAAVVAAGASTSRSSCTTAR